MTTPTRSSTPSTTSGRDFPDLDVRQAGDLTLDDAIDDRVAADLSSAEVISLPITLLLMLLAFGALIAAGIPVLLAATSVAATIGIIAPLSHLVPAEPTVTSMIVLIGMAVGVDYSLFYLKREREERAAGRSTLDAVEIAAADLGPLDPGVRRRGDRRDGRPVPDDRRDVQQPRRRLDPRGRDRGARLDHRAARAAGQARPLGGPAAGAAAVAAQPPRSARAGISRRLLGPVLRHPVAALLLGGAVVAVLAVPALGMKTHSGNLDTLPGDIAEVQTIKADHRGVPLGGPVATGRGPRRRDGPGRGRDAARRPGPGSGRRRGCSGSRARAGRGLRPTVVRRSSSWPCRSRSPTSRSTTRSGCSVATSCRRRSTSRAPRSRWAAARPSRSTRRTRCRTGCRW